MKPTLLFTFLLFFVFSVQTFAEEKKPTYVVDFSVGHKALDKEYNELVKDFAKRVEERTDGTLKINIVNLYDGFRNEQELTGIAKGQILEGISGIAQMPIDAFWNTSETIDVLAIPYIFNDHKHIENVIYGNIGDELMNSIAHGTDGKAKAIALVFEGYRNLYTTGEQKSLSELEGLQTRFFRKNRISRDIMHNLGIKQSDDLGGRWDIARRDGEILVGESDIYNLFNEGKQDPSITESIKYVFLTEHSALISTITVHKPLYDSLQEEHQRVLAEEIQKLSKKQTTLILEQESQAKKKLEKMGITFVKISDSDKNLMDVVANKINKKYNDFPIGKFAQKIAGNN